MVDGVVIGRTVYCQGARQGRAPMIAEEDKWRSSRESPDQAGSSQAVEGKSTQ